MRLFMVHLYVNVIYLTTVFNTVFDDAAPGTMGAGGTKRSHEYIIL